MKLLSIALLKTSQDATQPYYLCFECDVSSFSFIQRNGVRESLLFVGRTMASKTPMGKRISVLHQTHMCHSYNNPDGLCSLVICDEEYPSRVAFSLGLNVIKEFETLYQTKWKLCTKDFQFPLSTLPKTLAASQNPAEFDKITKVQNQLDETKDVLVQSINSLLERGETLDNLASRSTDLSNQSKVFYKATKGSCCIVI